ncbi:class I SAM-dependent methyltransferase [Campylobacter lanienae]|uniref:class I SAM-dependent methyltransferase n=1 Tax=Campylobacter lanienae TaxID=75658 RepID=UPI000BB43E3D|nr:class I SAM-dependent methyltransferase [Campylobacter lanienae]
MLKDSLYWDEFYKSEHREITKPTLFANFIYENYIKDQNIANLIEFGCGNGRDSLYFAKNNLSVTAIDSSHIAINALKKQNSDIRWINADFTISLDIRDKFDICYSRFTLHAIDDTGQNGLIENIKSLLKPNGLFVIEARSINDGKFGLGQKVGKNAFIFDNHYRRFIDPNELKIALSNSGFNIIYIDESGEFAPIKDENCVCIRVVARY